MGSRKKFPPSQFFVHEGRRIAYRIIGEGSRTIVFSHGLLMDVRMFSYLVPSLVAGGNRVVLVDMLGHGDSDQPHTMTSYSMTQFGADIVALLEHLKIDEAVIGGTSLGANIALEAAILAPHRIRALVIEMPVLENGIAAAAAAFVPLALALRLSHRTADVLARLVRKIPRTLVYVDVFLDFARRDPLASLAVLDGCTFGRIAPPTEERRTLRHPALVIGHRSDPLHPCSDADRLAEEMPNARMIEAKSIYEWRVRPSRLNRELVNFLDEVWARPKASLEAV